MAMRDVFEDAKSTADLRERKWSSSYCSHRARSCHSHVWFFEITAALKSRQPIWLAGRWWSKSGPRSNLDQGRKCSPQPEACSDAVCRLHDQDVHRDTQWKAPVCELEQITQMVVVPRKQLPFQSHVVQPADLFPKAMIWASKHHGKTGELWTGKWVWEQLSVLPKAAFAPSCVSTGLSAAQNYWKSPLMSIFKNAVIFCLHSISLSLFSISPGHTMPKDVILVVLHGFS